MACSTLSTGIQFCLCDKSMGGIAEVYLANRDDVDIDGVDASIDADGLIKDIPLIPSTASITHYKFFKFQIRKNTGSMTSTLNVDENTGSSVSTDLVLDWRAMDYQKRKAMSAFLQGEFVAIVVDANKNKWFLGLNLAVSASAGTGETGTTNTDANHYSITLNDVSNDWPHQIDPDFDITTILEAPPAKDPCDKS